MSDMRQGVNPDADPMRAAQLNPPPAAAASGAWLPQDVEDELDKIYLINQWRMTRTRNHLAALTAERDALRADVASKERECDELASQLVKQQDEYDKSFARLEKQRDEAYALGSARFNEKKVARARIDALRWVRARGLEVGDEDAMDEAEAEIRRLESLLADAGEGVA